MKTQDEISARQLFVKMVISTWDTQNARINKILESLSDEQLMGETAPGRNRGIYLLGHLTAVSDAMMPILGLGEKLYPALENIFIKQPDKEVAEIPSAAEIKKYWHAVNAELTSRMNKLSPDDWFARHTTVSAEDFEKEPHRNKLNIIINRTNHESYHLGQLAYLVKKK